MKFIISTLWLVIVIWAVLKIIGSSASGLHKVLWILLILFFPVIGMVIWFFAGPK